MSNFFSALGATVLSLSMTAAAQQPPESPPSPQPDEPASSVSEEGGRAYFRDRLRHEQINPWLWNEASDFVRQHSPNRWAALQAMPDGRAKLRVMRLILSRYQNLMMLRGQGDAALYDMAIRRIETEDIAWGLSMELAASPSPERGEELQKQLSQTIRELVELGLKERAARITNLESALRRERQRLKHDQSRVDELIAEHLRKWTERAPALDGPEHGGFDEPNPRRRPEDRPRQRQRRDGKNDAGEAAPTSVPPAPGADNPPSE